jgi:hypothetical protein
MPSNVALSLGFSASYWARWVYVDSRWAPAAWKMMGCVVAIGLHAGHVPRGEMHWLSRS